MRIKTSDSVETGVRQHFLPEEWNSFSTKWERVVRFTHFPLEVFENPAKWKPQDRNDIGYYAKYLAFFRRITLPLTHTLNIQFRNCDFPISQHPNFLSCRTLLERYYASCGLQNSGVGRSKDQIWVETTALRLWLSGYGVMKGDNCSPITDHVMNESLELSRTNTGRAIAFFRRILIGNPDTLVSPQHVRVGVSSHFTAAEWHNTFGTGWDLVSPLLETPLDKLENPSNWPALPGRHVSTYAARLAFYQRIRLPLAFCISQPYSAGDFPVDAIENFKIFDQLFDRCFPVLYKLEVNNSRLKETIRRRLRNRALEFWLAGYGLRHNDHHRAIDRHILRLAEGHAKTSTHKKSIRLLGILLEHDQQCRGSFVPRTSRGSRIKELEEAAWRNNLPEGVQTPCSELLCRYVFGELLSRVQGPQVAEATLSDAGSKILVRREGLSSISIQTWNHYSRALRLFAEWCQINNYPSIDQCLIPGVADFLREGKPSGSRSIKMTVRGALRQWLDWYTRISGTRYTQSKVIPRIVRRSRVPHGILLDLASAELLIDTLLDDQSPAFSENSILEFRCRRAVLIALATGGRGKSIRLLFKDCLKTDHNGHHFLFFHSVKTKPSHEVEVGPDIVQWVEELQRIAPQETICFPADTAQFGDGLTEYRLLANANDDGPLSQNTINNFLKRVQHHLWPTRHPNGRYFTLHDARRLQAIYLLLREKRLEEIKQRLGQTKVGSVLPYVATKPPQYQRWYAEILKQGIWKNVSDRDGESDGLPLDQVINQTSRMTNVSSNKEFVHQLIEKTLEDQHNPYELKRGRVLPVNMVASGFPRRSHHCTAHELLNCGHTELHCFSCDKYNPDSTMLEDHKAEVFRFMILALRARLAKKQRGNTIERQAVELREESVMTLLEEAIPKLFGNRYGLSPVTIKKLKAELWAGAKQFMRGRGLDVAAPTFTEAVQFIRRTQIGA